MIASGGFADARGLVAALALGADGINMGSRFMCTVESCIHQNVKEAIVAGSEPDTELIFRPSAQHRPGGQQRGVARGRRDPRRGRPVRGRQGSGRRCARAEGVRDGDLDAGIWSVGTAMGLINDIPTVGELVSRIVAEAEDLITGRLAGWSDQTKRRWFRPSGQPSRRPSSLPFVIVNWLQSPVHGV